MKELTIEQKAQRYDEALNRAKDFHKGYKQRDNQLYTDDLESIFPELKESEDVCDYSTYFITYFKNAYGENSNVRFAGIKVKDIIAWLEKSTWKPSDEQMAALLVAVGDEKKLGSDVNKGLYELYLQLKQL